MNENGLGRYNRGGTSLLMLMVAGLLTLGPICASVSEDLSNINADVIVEGDWLVTMQPGQAVIGDGAVAVKNGLIVAAGPRQRIATAFRARRTIDGEGRVLLPGLVNAHTHAAMTLFRGFADDKALMDWLENYIFPAENAFVNDEFVRVGTTLACWEMIRSGTTTFVDMYFYTDVIAEIVDQCGLRAVIAPSIMDHPFPGSNGWQESFDIAVDFIKRWQGHERIVPAFGPHAPYTVSAEHLREVAVKARELHVPVTIHLAETKDEFAKIQSKYKLTPVQLLDEQGLLGPNLIAAHVIWADPADIALLAAREVGVIHNPTSNLKLASGIAPVPAMLDAGIAVGLGTDGAASNNDLDLWEEIRLAALIHKAHNSDPKVIPALSALRMATSSGAKAIGLGDEIGVLSVGRKADMIQLSLKNRPHTIPIFNIISHLVYSAKSSDVVTVMVDGKVLMENGQIATIDEAMTLENVRQINHAITKTLP